MWAYETPLILFFTVSTDFCIVCLNYGILHMAIPLEEDMAVFTSKDLLGVVRIRGPKLRFNILQLIKTFVKQRATSF